MHARRVLATNAYHESNILSNLKSTPNKVVFSKDAITNIPLGLIKVKIQNQIKRMLKE